MKNIYKTPIVELIKLGLSDVLSLSNGNNNNDGFSTGEDNGWEGI